MHDERLLGVFRESQDRIQTMALVHEKLYRSKDIASIDFTSYMEDLLSFLFSSYEGGTGRISLLMDIGKVALDIDWAIPCGLIINELVSNALKYAFPDDRRGEIAICFAVDEDDWITFKVADNGIGLPPALDPWRTETLGLQLVRLLVRQLQGEISLAQQGGTTFTIRFWGRRARN
jgi:two-component sensor histidine kinase